MSTYSDLIKSHSKVRRTRKSKGTAASSSPAEDADAEAEAEAEAKLMRKIKTFERAAANIVEPAYYTLSEWCDDMCFCGMTRDCTKCPVHKLIAKLKGIFDPENKE